MIDWVQIVEHVPQAAALTTLAGIVKLPLSLVQWLRSNRTKKSKQTIDEYLEWLRRENHEELRCQLVDNGIALDELRQLIKALHGLSADRFDRVFEELSNIRETLFELTEHPQREAAEFEKQYLEAVRVKFQTLRTFGIAHGARELRQPLSIA